MFTAGLGVLLKHDHSYQLSFLLVKTYIPNARIYLGEWFGDLHMLCSWSTFSLNWKGVNSENSEVYGIITRSNKMKFNKG